MKVLILCTGNSCRSQMAHGFLKSFDHDLEVYSTGTQPAKRVNPKAVEVIIGFDDPSDAIGSEEYIMSEFWRVRDEIKNRFENFYKTELK